VLGIDHERDRATRAQDPGDRRGCQHALGVVAEDDRIGRVARGELRQQPRAHFRRTRLHVLPVETQQLLTVAQHAQLARGVAAGKLEHRAGIDAGAGAQRQQLFAGRVVPAHPGNADARAQGGDLARHVGGTSEPMLTPLCAHHGHRGLGRDALDRTAHVLIDHQVADHPDTQVGEALGERKERARVADAAHEAGSARMSASSDSQSTWMQRV